MARQRIDVSKIWDDESGEPCPLTVEEFDARVEASTLRMKQENDAAEARLNELEQLVAQKEAILAHLQATFEEARRETDRINARAKALREDGRRAQKRTGIGRSMAKKTQPAL